MPNENDIIEKEKEEEIATEPDYIKVIEDMKKNTVPKELYNKLKSENSKILDAYINDKKIDVNRKEETVNVDELRKDLFGKELSNLDYAKKALKLRTELIKRGERDPFLPVGSQVKETQNTYEAAERVASVLQDCVDYAQGDSNLFTAELQRRTKDAMPTYGRRR